ncbi:MAG: hypothetical protein IJ789_05010 [Bacteroidales bacterium]|nr:hypothetical protein [Bacteroidales bacterium]MBR1799849.1 hypothetical protein [Bacteroidales bacterium]MBR1850717.1 hypothetical protein [Bacteroidales bacterium]
MKKFFMPLVATLALSFGLASCSGDEVLLDSVKTYVMEEDVYPADWQEADGYLYCTFNWNAITDAVMRDGTVNAYIYEYVYDEARQIPLPYVYPMTWNMPDSTQQVLPEMVRFDFQRGQITFLIEEVNENVLTRADIATKYKFRAVATVPVTYIIEQ